MKIRSLHIISFGGLDSREIHFDSGVNVIDGANESGKTSAAMFIKFIFYGLSGKVVKSLGCSERQKYVNQSTNQAAGYMIAEADDGIVYRIERAIILSDSAPSREKTRIIRMDTGEVIKAQSPGEYFFGVPEDVFLSTAFVAQSGEIKPGEKSSGAVANLLTSADEALDIGRAVRKLESARRELSHKSGQGGRIGELIARRDALMAEEESTGALSTERRQVSASLGDISSHIVTLEKTKSKYDRVYRALEVINRAGRIDNVKQAEEKLAKLEATLDNFDKSPLGEGFFETLDSAERDITAYDEAAVEYNRRLPEFLEREKDIPLEHNDIEDACELDAASRVQIAVAIVMLVGSFFAAAAAVVLWFFNTGMHLLPTVLAAILMTLSVAFFITRAVNKRKLIKILDKWDVDDVYELEEAVREELSRDAEPTDEEHRRMSASLEALKLRFNVAVDTVKRLVRDTRMTEYTDVYDTIDALRDHGNEAKKAREQLVSKIDQLKGRLEVMKEELSGVDYLRATAEYNTLMGTKDGQLASSMGEASVKKLVHERQFIDNQYRTALKRKSNLEAKLSEMDKPRYTPEEISTELYSLNKQIEELSSRRDAYELAIEALTEAGHTMREGVLPRLKRRASELVSKVTGKYTDVTLDSSMTIGLTGGDSHLTSEHISRGTGDLSYIALRIALSEEVFRAERSALVFDESFAHIDGGRVESVIKLLTEEKNGQYIVFTCRSEEALAAERLGAKVISL